MTINLDTRRIKRIDGRFTVETSRSLSKVEQGLCDYCGRFPCLIKSLLSEGSVMTMHACAHFVPILSFSVLHGLDLPRWNTVRLGAAWKKRLVPGDRVGVYDTVNGRMMRIMEVEDVHVSSLESIITDHAVNNHAILARNPADPNAELFRIVKNAFGTNYTKPDRPATALYLRKPREAAKRMEERKP